MLKVSLLESRRRKSDDSEEEMGAQEREEEDGAPSVGGKLQKTSKEVYFSVLPDKYEPLIEDDEEREETAEERKRRKEARKKKRKNRCKKYRKNVGKALRFSWRCLVAGLQSMASVYSTPLSAVATVVTDVHQASGSKT